MKVTASLYEKNGKYHVSLSWMENGTRKRKSIALGLDIKGNKRVANKRMEELRQNLEDELAEYTERVLFSDYLMHWLDSIRFSIADTTYIEYRAQIKNRIAPWFAERKIALADLKAHQIQDFYQYKLSHDKVSANTVHRYHACIRKSLQDAFKLDRIAENPADKVTLPKVKRYKADFLNSKELRRVLEIFKGTAVETPVFLTAWYGLRRGEVLGLRWSDVDFTAKTISVNGSITDRGEASKKQSLRYKETKTEASIRTFPLLPEVESYLREVALKQAENRLLCGECYNQDWSAYICVDTDGDLLTPDRLTRAFPRICEQNGLRHVTFHALRHSCASLLLENGASMKETQDWLGHASFRTTANIYAHVTEGSKEKLARSLSSVLFRSAAP